MSKKLAAILSLATSLGVVMFLFGNCSSEHAPSSDSNSSLKLGNCSLTGPDQLFSLTYAPILQNKCATCHIPGGTGKGAFASPGLALAFDAFSLVGYKRVGQYAVDPNHQPPYTGSVNAAAIKEATTTWELGVQELATCKNNIIEEFVDDPWDKVRVYSRSRAINPSATDDVKVQWNLNTDMLAPPEGVVWPNMPGAIFEITLRANISGKQANYMISRPRIVYPTANASAVDIRLQSIRIRLNGQDVINETTFHYVDANVRKNTDTLLSAGGMVALGNLKMSDVISVSFGKAEVVVLPPPPPVPTLQFAVVAQTSAESGRRQVVAQLSQAVDSFVTASYSLSEGTARQPCCSSIQDVEGEIVSVKNFDRDYILPVKDGGTIVFEPNQTQKIIDIDIVDDQRDEADETIIMTLESVSMGFTDGVLGANKKHTITITDNDAAPGPYEVTYSNLMAAGGAFNRYCVRCHHSDSQDVLAREYDMTTHTDLISENRVIPGNATLSLLWGRILGFWQGEPIDPMPQNGLFNPEELQAKDEIYQWIMSGAKNN